MIPRINQLAPEILSTVFKFAVPISMDYHACLNRIQHTSFYWADIVRKDPSFWTVLHCSDAPQLVETAIERSNNLPLQLHFPCYDVPYSQSEREEDDYRRESHDHNDFLDLLGEHIPPRTISQLHIQAYQHDWSSFSKFLTTPAPVLSSLSLWHQRYGRYSRSSLGMRGLYLFGGVAPKLHTMELTFCDLPSKYPPLPALHTCAIGNCTLSRYDLVHLISAAPALESLSVASCTATSTGEVLRLTPIQTRIQHLFMQYNTLKDDSGDGLTSALDYFQAPDLESFVVETGTDGTKPRISEWISAFSAASEISALGISLVPNPRDDSYVVFMALGPNFRLTINQPQHSTETPDSVILGLLNGIHPSAYASIKSLDLALSEPFVNYFLPTLASKFTATTEFILYTEPQQSWLYLGQKQDGEWPFPRLTTLRINQLWLMDGTEMPLLDMLRAREEIVDGLKTIHFNSGQVGPAFLSAAQGLGVTVQTGSYTELDGYNGQAQAQEEETEE